MTQVILDLDGGFGDDAAAISFLAGIQAEADARGETLTLSGSRGSCAVRVAGYQMPGGEPAALLSPGGAAEPAGAAREDQAAASAGLMTPSYDPVGGGRFRGVIAGPPAITPHGLVWFWFCLHKHPWQEMAVECARAEIARLGGHETPAGARR